MKKISNKNVLSFQKFQIAKLNNLHTIIGGIANNVNAEYTNTEEEEGENQSTTTDTWTTITKEHNVISG